MVSAYEYKGLGSSGQKKIKSNHKTKRRGTGGSIMRENIGCSSLEYFLGEKTINTYKMKTGQKREDFVQRIKELKKKHEVD